METEEEKYEPPVTRTTFPSREGMSFSGLKSTRPVIAGMVLESLSYK